MKPILRFSSRRGSALLSVMFLTGLMMILTVSMLKYGITEKSGNERNRLTLRAKNMAENISVYAAEQLTTKLYRLGTAPVMKFPWTGTSRNRVWMPPTNVLDSQFTSESSGMELRAGIQSASAYTLVSDASSPNNGLQVSTAMVPIIAKATATHPIIGSVTAYVQQDMELALTPLFQFGMFYNMDMELYPSQAFAVVGPVHTNNRLIAHPDGSTTIAITFWDRVTAAAGVYWNTATKAKPRGSNGVENLPVEGNGDVIFTHTNGTTQVTMKEASKWRDHMYKTTSETTSTLSQFKTWATTTFNGNLRTNVHGVTRLELPGIGTYKETDDPSTPTVDERNNGRQLIEPPDPKKWNGTTWSVVADDADTKESKISRKAGLYIVVNPDDTTPRSFTLPDDTTKYILPRSYRAWLNVTQTDSSHTLTEIVLPGQPTYGYNNGADGLLGTADDYMYRNHLPNRYDTTTVCGDTTGNQVLRIPQSDFGTGSGYQINGAHAVNVTALALKTGTGTILPGNTLVIGAHQYLVTAALAGGTVHIASPGLRVALVDNTVVTLGTALGTAANYRVNGAHAAGATTVAVNTGTGTILPGNTLTIGNYQYTATNTIAAAGNVTITPALRAALTTNTVVAVSVPANAQGMAVGGFTLNGAHALNATTLTLAATTNTIMPGNTITITPPLRVATATGTAVTLDNQLATLGTGEGYFINNAAGYAAGATVLAVDTGSGTIIAGSTITIGAYQYLVTDATAGAAVTSITIANPGLRAAVTDNTLVIVDPFAYSGYSTQIVAPSGAITNGSIFPADSLAAAPYTYFPADAYFFDLRRADGNRGVISTSGTTALYDRFTVNYEPRPIAKIDFDMSRFKMMVDRVVNAATVSNVYDVRAPAGAASVATWANSIFNSAGARANLGLGGGAAFNVFPASTDVVTRTRLDPFQVYYAPANPEDATTLNQIMTNPTTMVVPSSVFYDASNPCAWYDGIAVYIHSVDAEMRAQSSGIPNRLDSGVRLVNGRGPVVSLSATGKTGCTIVTNDAAYIIGHYNADGAITSTAATTGNNGYSAQWPDSANEKLCAVMGDAITILAQPQWDAAAGGQTDGWNDALSALPVVASSASWRTGAAATSTLNGSDDGVITGANGPRPGLLPNQSFPGTLNAAQSIKLLAINTEVSTALLVGIVPSNHNPAGLTDNPPSTGANGVNSGGANNFPRLGDSWSGQSLYIRGSMVALFESRVAMEPFTNSRNYRAPGRFWGLHENFATANHDIPLEPIVLSSTRIGFRELTAAEYAAKKAVIEALP